MVEFHGGRLAPDPSLPRMEFKQFKVTDYSPPNVCDFYSKVPQWPMYLNDLEGDCTIAAAAHMRGSWSFYGIGDEVLLTNKQINVAYSAVSGFDPATGANDNGAVMQQVLSFWRKTGIGGKKIIAFAEVDISNFTEVKQAVSLFGSVYLGINFPAFAMDQFNQGLGWDVSDTNTQIEGGHCIPALGYNNDENIWYVVTWGKVIPMTDAFFDKYVEEAWLVVSDEFVNAQGVDPNGADLYELGQAFADITGERNPFPADPTPPEPVPPSPEPTPAPTPAPDDVTRNLIGAMDRFMETKEVPEYVREAYEDWRK